MTVFLMPFASRFALTTGAAIAFEAVAGAYVAGKSLPPSGSAKPPPWQAHPVGLAGGAVDERQRRRNLLLRQDVGHAVTFSGMLQYQFEAELLGDAHGGHEVVGAMAVEVHGTFTFEHLDERLESDVAID